MELYTSVLARAETDLHYDVTVMIISNFSQKQIPRVKRGKVLASKSHMFMASLCVSQCGDAKPKQIRITFDTQLQPLSVLRA